MQQNRTIGPGKVVNIDGQRFLAAQTTIIDEPEECAISWIFYSMQHGLDLLGIQSTSYRWSFGFAFDTLQKRFGDPSSALKKANETAQHCQASIVRRGRKGFLREQKRPDNSISERRDRCLTDLSQQGLEIFGITFARSSRKGRPFKKVLEGVSN